MVWTAHRKGFPVYIHRIELHNIRGFDTLTFDLDRGGGQYAGWTVFTGDNGSGKSTLLKAIAVALTGTEEARALEPSFRRWLREGEHRGSIELEIVPVKEDDSFAQVGRTTENRFPAKIVIENGSREAQLKPELPPKKQKSYSTPQRSIWSHDAGGWFSCGYGPFRRVFGASPDAVRAMVAPTSERFVTMFQEAASLSEVDLWLKNLSHKELEGKQEERDQLGVVLQILRDGLLPNEMTIERVDSDGLWLKDRNGILLDWRDMSEGYRAALALLTDILRHIIKTFGSGGLTEQTDGMLQVQRSGVVLIDEIDLHLHPEWQRKIGFWLKQRFPKLQFLVTTHSPLICQAADPNGVFKLPPPDSGVAPFALSKEDYEKVIKSKSDEILLSPAFGLQNTRSPQAVENRKRHASLEAKRRTGGQLSQKESEELGQLRLWVATDSDD
jgi:energy-coupling factor transporter ATP-binding protein EcfA2